MSARMVLRSSLNIKKIYLFIMHHELSFPSIRQQPEAPLLATYAQTGFRGKDPS